MTAGSVLPHMTECCGEEYLSWKPVSKGGQLILFYFIFFPGFSQVIADD